MSVERLLQICVAIMAVLATVLLGLGQQNIYLPLVALLAASLSLVFTDTLGWFRLNRGVANVFALIAASYSLSSFFRFDKEQQLLSIANLMVYLQFILFFQEKSPRVYWQLLVLGLLQVVVAVALSIDVVAAGIMIVYMLVGVTALTLFFLHCESFRVTGKIPRPQLTFRRRARKIQEAQPTGGPPTKPRAEFMADPRALSWELVGPRLLRQIAAMGALSLLFATVLFYTVPRHGDSIWRGPGSFGESQTGFPELQEMSFDETGQIAESDDAVMRVSFSDSKTNQPYRVVGRAYFRGIVLMHYSLSKRQWTQRFNRRGGGVPARLRRPPANRHLVRQEVVLEPSNQELLFSIYPCWRDLSSPNQVVLDRANAKLFLPRHERLQDGGPLRYSIVTDAFRNGWQLRAGSTRNDRLLLGGRAGDYLTDVNSDTQPGSYSDLFDLNSLAGLAEKASQVVDSAANVDPSNHLQVARVLEQHFRTGGEYRYSLDFRSLQRDGELDPLEDFVVNHRTGHCEYFAGALALMLRSRNIPARVVVGYVGGEFNPMGGFYQIRKKDAHAWVEAYVAPRHFDPNMLLPPGAERSGIWYRLDPTPASGDLTTSTAASLGLRHKCDQFLDYFKFVWSDYVVGLDEKRQQGVYHRLEDQPRAIGGSRVRSWLDGAAGNLGLTAGEDGNKPRIRWPLVLGLLTGGLVAGAIARRLARRRGKSSGPLIRLVSRVIGMITPRAGLGNASKPSRSRPQAGRVEFYARLVRIAAPLGLVRAAGQTPHEFAESICGRLRERQQDDAVAGLPVSVVDAFYRVRFGGAALDTREQKSIEQALSKLEQVLVTHQD